MKRGAPSLSTASLNQEGIRDSTVKYGMPTPGSPVSSTETTCTKYVETKGQPCNVSHARDRIVPGGGNTIRDGKIFQEVVEEAEEAVSIFTYGQ